MSNVQGKREWSKFRQKQDVLFDFGVNRESLRNDKASEWLWEYEADEATKWYGGGRDREDGEIDEQILLQIEEKAHKLSNPDNKNSIPTKEEQSWNKQHAALGMIRVYFIIFIYHSTLPYLFELFITFFIILCLNPTFFANEISIKVNPCFLYLN